MRGLIFSRMSRGGCYRMTTADWLISPPAAQILPGLLRERVRMAKIKETERVRIQSVPAFFCKSRVTRDASACARSTFPQSCQGSLGVVRPYSPDMTGGTYKRRNQRIRRLQLQEKQHAHLLGGLPPALGLLPSGHQTAQSSLRTGAQHP